MAGFSVPVVPLALFVFLAYLFTLQCVARYAFVVLLRQDIVVKTMEEDCGTSYQLYFLFLLFFLARETVRFVRVVCRIIT